ncbi:sigma-70 family RNA polymerase sigma factor [Capillimicrobium parvum]|uniref:RNA polymerase sigma factor n=1 Tax=Capillimicrobium parvum TaxID=2884022 RepID=A0A9E6XYI2_9ACTN|nr:sigma-70 family RNA polymerase sigma factor [Capillimicrobium parvum]UGS36815.1 ECF RNA polymerase sigma factor SigG [Capillimicrobium parvum]
MHVDADATLQRARSGDEAAFRALTDPHRRELQVHCYRIVGSVQDAEDLVQETLLAAWRGLADFEGRATVRSWLYRIATNRCLNALRAVGRRPEGMMVAGPPADAPEPTRRAEPLWLQPYPDALLDGLADRADGPDARYETREAVGLAFVSGLQRMAPLQRAVLVLRDVLGYRAAEVAEMLDASEASVNSALQRARAALEAAPSRPGGATLPESPAARAVVTAFADAFERGDVEEVVALLTDDAWVRMPPEPHEYQGRPAIAAFLRSRPIWRGGHGIRLVPTQANGQPAFAYYLIDPHAPGVMRAGGVIVLTLEGEAIAAVTRFGDCGVLPYFGLPRTLPV